jgi:hypothetical protein
MAIVFVGLLFSAVVSIAQPYRYEPVVVTLQGTLVSAPGQTPDGKPLTFPALKLNAPIAVLGSGDSPAESNVDLLHMVLNQKTAAAFRDLKGKRVLATGSLFHADNGNHQTAVLIAPTSIVAASDPTPKSDSSFRVGMSLRDYPRQALCRRRSDNQVICENTAPTATFFGFDMQRSMVRFTARGSAEFVEWQFAPNAFDALREKFSSSMKLKCLRPSNANEYVEYCEASDPDMTINLVLTKRSTLFLQTKPVANSAPTVSDPRMDVFQKLAKLQSSPMAQCHALAAAYMKAAEGPETLYGRGMLEPAMQGYRNLSAIIDNANAAVGGRCLSP